MLAGAAKVTNIVIDLPLHRPLRRRMDASMTPLVCVVDDDESVRESLPDLLQSFGLTVQAFSSAERFLASDCLDRTSCLILDVAMPGMTGPELERELKDRDSGIPIVFITAHSTDDGRDEILRNGAVDCLLKPFSETALIKAVRAALTLAEAGDG
jgi:FixJ family two-component response regulator